MGSASDYLLAPATTRSLPPLASTKRWSGQSSSRPSVPPSQKALVRGDTGAYLSVVGKSYEVVQFAEVARTLVEAAGDVKAVFSTAGTLGPVGVRGWLLGELPNPVKVKGDESEIRKYVLGCAGHDGYTAVVIKNVATRVVCANTLGVALGERGGASWRIQHTASAKERLEDAGKAFGRIADSYESFGELANVLAETRFTGRQMQSAIDQVLPVPVDDRDHRRLLVGREKVQRLFETAVGVEKLRGTAWAALQGWTEYADHHRAPAGHRQTGAASGQARVNLDGKGGGHEAGGAGCHRPGDWNPAGGSIGGGLDNRCGGLQARFADLEVILAQLTAGPETLLKQKSAAQTLRARSDATP